MKPTATFIILTILQCNAFHSIEPYNQSIATEDFGKAYLYSNTWKTLHYINITSLITESTHIFNHLTELRTACFHFKGCELKLTLQSLIDKAQSILDRTHTIIAITRSENKRSKRGLIDGVGTGLNWLFGTMDANDAKDISHAIDNV